MIIYSKSTGTHSGAIGMIETPIKMILEHESDLQKKKGGICEALFNVERSQRFGETIVGGNEFDTFSAVAEGEAAVQDETYETYQKFIEHIQFMKEFVISAEMMEDANYGIAADAKHRAENFIRAYYKTINRICEGAPRVPLIGAKPQSTLLPPTVTRSSLTSTVTAATMTTAVFSPTTSLATFSPKRMQTVIPKFLAVSLRTAFMLLQARFAT